MIWRKTWRRMLVGVVLAWMAVFQAGSASEQSEAPPQPGSPTYAIPLKDGNSALVWWDAISNPAHPGWRCEVPPPRGSDAGRTITALSAAPGDWRAAVMEARERLKDRVADCE